MRWCGSILRLQTLDIVVVKDLDRPVHALGLTVGPRMVGLGQTAMLDADAVKEVWAEELLARAGPVLGEISERHAVVFRSAPYE